jgi:hypothetical protein
MYQCASSHQTPDLLLCDDKSKHVSFDTSLVRSNTIGGGIDSGSADPGRLFHQEDGFLDDGRAASAFAAADPSCSNERLISAGMFALSPMPPDQYPATMSFYPLTPSSSNSLRLIKRTTIVKTRATQTDGKGKSGRFKGSSKSVSDAVPSAITRSSTANAVAAAPVVRHDVEQEEEDEEEVVPIPISRDQSPDPLAYLMLSPRSRRHVISSKSIVTSTGKVNYHYHKHSLAKKNSLKTSLTADEERSSPAEFGSEIGILDQQNAVQIECQERRRGTAMDENGIRNQAVAADEEEGDERTAVSLQSCRALQAESVPSAAYSPTTCATTTTTKESQCLEAVAGGSRESACLLEKSTRSHSGSLHSTIAAQGLSSSSRAPVIQRQRSTASCKQEKKRRREQWQSMKYRSYSSDEEEEKEKAAESADPHLLRRHSIADAGTAVQSALPILPETGKRSEPVNDVLREERVSADVVVAADVTSRIEIDIPVSVAAKEQQAASFSKKDFESRRSLFQSLSSSSASTSSRGAIDDRIRRHTEEQASDEDVHRSLSHDLRQCLQQESPALTSEPIVSLATESQTSSTCDILKSSSDTHSFRDESGPVLSPMHASSRLFDDNSRSQAERADDHTVITREKEQAGEQQQQQQGEETADEKQRRQEELQQQCMQSFMGSLLTSPSSDEVSASSHLIELTSSPEYEIEGELGKESGSSVYVTATERTPHSSSKSKTPASTAGTGEKTTTYETASSSLFSLISSPASSGQRKSSQESGTDSHLSPTNREDIDFSIEPQVRTFSFRHQIALGITGYRRIR